MCALALKPVIQNQVNNSVLYESESPVPNQTGFYHTTITEADWVDRHGEYLASPSGNIDFWCEAIQDQVKLIKFWARKAIVQYHAENPAVGDEDP